MMNGYGIHSGDWSECAGGFGIDLSTLVLIGLALFAIYIFFKNKQQTAKKPPIVVKYQPSLLEPEEVVRLRYARGEISFEGFQEILKNIQS